MTKAIASNQLSPNYPWHTECRIQSPGKTTGKSPPSHTHTHTHDSETNGWSLTRDTVFDRHGYGSESNHESAQNQMFFAWVMSWFESKIGKHSESWVDLNQYLGIHLSHELILRQFLESCLSHEFNRFKSPRYCLSHELIRIDLSGKALESKAQKRSYEVNTWMESQKKIRQWMECPKRSHETGNG